MKELSYIKKGKYTDLVKFENHVWYGLLKVLGKDFCKTGYFKPYWNEVKNGKWRHVVNGFLIDVDVEQGVFITKQEKSDDVKTNNEIKGPTVFNNIVEEGDGSECEVRYYHKGKQVGYLETSKLLDETVPTGMSIAKTMKVETHELNIVKNWVHGEENDYL